MKKEVGGVFVRLSGLSMTSLIIGLIGFFAVIALPQQGFASTTSAGSNPQCDSSQFSIADQLKMMSNNIANQTISDLITQPPSVAQLSCLDQLSAKYGSEIGNKFLDDIGLGSGRADFEGIINDTFIGSVIDNFMGGALSGIQEAVNGAISNTISNVANAILPGVGGGIGNLLGGGTDFDCQIMKTIWELIQCQEFPDFPKIFDLDFGGSFLSRPDSCAGQALYDGAIETLNNSGVSQGLENWGVEQSQELNRSIRCSIGSGSDC